MFSAVGCLLVCVVSSHRLCSHSITFIDALCSPTPSHTEITSMWVILVLLVVDFVAAAACELRVSVCIFKIVV